MDRHVRILGSRLLRQAEKPANQGEDNNRFMEHRVIPNLRRAAILVMI
jgi:hypothetical protein